jgi:hypothetical protein
MSRSIQRLLEIILETTRFFVVVDTPVVLKTQIALRYFLYSLLHRECQVGVTESY